MPGYVCKLEKSMYGAKQAGEIWGSVLDERLKGFGFVPSKLDGRLYIFSRNEVFIIVVIVVDDLAFASNSVSLMSEFKTCLSAEFDVKLYGKLTSFIGWNISYHSDGIKIDQRGYAKDILEQSGMLYANPTATPLPKNADLSPANENDYLLSEKNHAAYRSIIGGLLYLATCTRPDLSFSVSVLARHLHQPTIRHLSLLKRVLRYLKGTVELGIKYKSSKKLTLLSLDAHVDADWAGCKETRKSTTGFIICINDAPIIWKTKKQSMIALSSAEAEYIALSECSKQISWLRKLFWEVFNKSAWNDDEKFNATNIKVDSTAAISMATNDQVSARNKHIELKIHHVRALLKNKLITLSYIPSKENAADLLTKVLDLPTMKHLLSRPGLRLE